MAAPPHTRLRYKKVSATPHAKAYYQKAAREEWNRLVQDPFHKLEFDTTLHFLKKYLPKKGLVLDAGGGPGRYTLELARKGYRVVLLDITPGNLDFAQKQIQKAHVQGRVEALVEGSITNLSLFPNNSFDAVLCLGGPLSHVKGVGKRRKAASELVRVAKKDAPIFISVMGKLGVLIESPLRWPNEINMTKHFFELVNKGDDTLWHGKYYAHFFTIDELKRLFAGKTRFLQAVGLEGVSSPMREAVNKLQKKYPIAWKNWLRAHYKLVTQPAVADTSAHMMLICRKL